MSDSTASTSDAVEAAVSADEAAPDARVTWAEGDGTPRAGVIVSTEGTTNDPPTVTVVPDDDPENVIELPLDILELEAAEAAEGEDDAEGEGDDDTAPEADAAEGDAADAADALWAIVTDHPDCTGPEGTVAVVVVSPDGAEGAVESCHTDEDAAQAHIDDLLAAVSEDGEETDEDASFDSEKEIGSATVKINVTGLSALERAAELAAQVERTMIRLEELAPEMASITAPTEESAVSDAVVVEPVEASDVEAPVVTEDIEPDEAATADADGHAAAVEVEDESGDDPASLSEASEDDLMAELARRFAERTAAEIGVTADDVTVTGMEVEVNVDASGAVETAAADVIEAAADEAVEAAAEDDAPAPEADAEGDEAEASSDFDWDGVLIVEGLPSGDGRMIAENALTWRELPIPLMLQTVNAKGHEGAIICGSIHAIDRDGQNIIGSGNFDSGAAGQEALRLLSEGTMRGVSADIDKVVVEFVTESGETVPFEEVAMGQVEATEILVEGRIMGATLTPFPAFQEAHVRVISSDSPDEAMVASGSTYQGDVWRVPSPIGLWPAGEKPASVVASAALESLVASAAASDIVDVPVRPPAEWFEVGEMEEPIPFTISPEGRCYGLVAQFGSCHIGFTDRCVDVPRSASNYRHFRNKSVLTAEDTLVPTGPIFMDTVHPNLRLKASDAQAHYADTGCAFADVALYENEFGIVAAGALRPGLTEAQVRRARASDVSPDWRTIGGRLEAVGLLSVNVSGFVVEGLVASAGGEVSLARGLYNSVEGQVTALVAAGMIHNPTYGLVASGAPESAEVLTDLTEQVADMRQALEEFVLAPAREARLAAARAKLGLSDPPSRDERLAAAMDRFGLSVPVEGERFSVRSDEDDEPAVEEFTVDAEADAHDCGGSCGASEGACSCEV